MRSVSYVQRVALEFSGSLFPHAICLGDVDNDTVGACALETQASAHAGAGPGVGEAAGACVLRGSGWRALQAGRCGPRACARALGEIDWEGPCGQLWCAASWVRWSGTLVWCPRGFPNGPAAWFNDLCPGGPSKLRGRLPRPFGAVFPFRASEINTEHARGSAGAPAARPVLARLTGRL